MAKKSEIERVQKYLPLAGVFFIYLIAVYLIRPWIQSPENDDWIYAKNALHVAQTGHFRFNGLESAWGFPQVLLAAGVIKVLGFSFIILRGLGVISTGATLFILDLFLREARLAACSRFLALSAFLFFPPTFVSSLTFMTDMPFLALWLLGCFLWMRAFRKLTFSSLCQATLATILCFSERQFGVFLSAVSLLYWFRLGEWRNPRKTLQFGSLFLLQVVVYFALSYEYVRLSGFAPSKILLPTSMVLPDSPLYRIPIDFFRLISYVGLFSVPLLFISSARPFFGSVRKPVSALSLFIYLYFTVMTVFFFRQRLFMPYFQNQLSNYGMFELNDIILGPRAELLSQGWLMFLTLAASVGSVGLVLQSVDWIKGLIKKGCAFPHSFLVLASALYLLVLLYVRDLFYDRYLFPVFASALIVIFSHSRESHRLKPIYWVGGGVAILGFIVWGLLTEENYVRWLEARWSAGEWAVSQGLRPDQIVGGYEWDGWWKDMKRTYPSVANIHFYTPGEEKRLEFGEKMKKIEYDSWANSGSVVVRINKQ